MWITTMSPAMLDDRDSNPLLDTSRLLCGNITGAEGVVILTVLRQYTEPEVQQRASSRYCSEARLLLGRSQQRRGPRRKIRGDSADGCRGPSSDRQQSHRRGAPGRAGPGRALA